MAKGKFPIGDPAARRAAKKQLKAKKTTERKSRGGANKAGASK